jgi:hypothetical protein
MTSVNFKRKMFFFLMALVLKGCGFNHPKTPVTDSNQNIPISFSFLTTNIFLPKCSECHETNMGNYGYLMNRNYIVPGSAESSLLYQLVSTGEMPQNGPPLNSREVTAIYNWIQNGAQNN